MRAISRGSVDFPAAAGNEPAAHHEASHCLAFLLLGCRIRSVEIADDGSGLTRYLTRRTAPLTRFEQAVGILAGPCGEQYFVGRIDRLANHDDRREALQLLGDHELDGDAQLDAAIDTVVQLIERHRRAIAALAAVLARRRWLDEDQLGQLLRR